MEYYIKELAQLKWYKIGSWHQYYTFET